MADKLIVLGVFPDEAAADAAVASLKAWDELADEIKLESMGVLVLDEEGKLKTHKVGKGTSGKGAGFGGVLALLTPVGLAAGVIGGAVLGALHHKGLGLSAGAQERIGAELAGGKAAVGMLAVEEQSSAITAKLVELGGTPEVFAVSQAAFDEAAGAQMTHNE